ncbi:MAG: DUF4388 domain-containing protein [Planctomycetes bacterium]|nr:DUF4388 domain-containing protein [Planctomycetota bacterium]
MALKGDLKSINLANVLQDIASNELGGTLTLRAGENHRLFWFEKGRLRLVGLGNGKGPSALNGLVALGRIKPGEINPRGGNVTFVRSLIKRGSVAREDVRAALEQQMTELVCDVFVWSGATFEFVEGDPDEDEFETSQLDYEIRLAPDSIIMEAVRRIDEWTEIKKSIISAEEIFVVLRERAEADGDPIIERVAAFFDGERRLRDIIDQTHLGQFAVFRAAAALLRSGAVRALTVKEAIERARAATGRKQYPQALAMARFGLAREPNNPELRQLTAESFEALQRTDEAASEYRQLAAAQIEAGRKEQAIGTYRKVLALAPRDTFAQESLFALLIELGKRVDAVQQGEALASAYKRAGLPDKAKEAYTRLIQAFGDDDDLLESAAEIARRLGDKKEAIVFYRRLFDRALARGENDAIIQHARTILRLDPTAEDIARRRMEVETGVFRRRQKLRRRLKVGIFLTVGALALGAALTYEVRARRLLSEVREDAIMNQKDLRTRLRRYNEFLDTYGWSLAVPEAQRERDKLEVLFVEQALPVPEQIEDARLLEALSAAQEVRGLVRRAEMSDRAEEALVKLRQRAGDLGNRFIEEAARLAREDSSHALEQLAQMTHPLALEAVQRLASHDSAHVRRAAVIAVGQNGSDQALETLITRLAVDPEPTVRNSALEYLRKKTGQDFGENHNLWFEWLRKRLQKAPLIAVLGAPEARVGKGQPAGVEWRLESNSATLDFAFVAEIEVKDVKNKTLLLKTMSTTPQRVHLRANQFIGGHIDLIVMTNDAHM